MYHKAIEKNIMVYEIDEKYAIKIKYSNLLKLCYINRTAG